MSSQLTLFDVQSKSGADFSPCGKYRYELWRKWNTKPSLMCVGLNPSTANADKNDPTINRLVVFAKEYGYGGLDMYNLFALISPYPEALYLRENTVQEAGTTLNNQMLINGLNTHIDAVLCWGSWKPKIIKHRVDFIKSLIPNVTANIMCFGTNKDGNPKHPLYLPKETKLIKFEI